MTLPISGIAPVGRAHQTRLMAEVEPSTVSQEVVFAAFQRLSPDHQQLLLWNRVDGLTYGEMAARLGITERRLVRRMAAMILAFSRNVDKLERCL